MTVAPGCAAPGIRVSAGPANPGIGARIRIANKNWDDRVLVIELKG